MVITPVMPPPNARPAALQPFVDHYLLPKEEVPLFCRAVSLCSTIHNESDVQGAKGRDSIGPDPFDKLCISDWVKLPHSPPPDDSFKSLGLEVADSAYSITDGVELCPSLALSAKDEPRTPYLSIYSTPQTTDDSTAK